jgi:hypothetical protein
MKTRLFLTALAVVASSSFALAERVRPAPDFRWVDARGATKTLSAFRGQPVVLLIAPTPRTRALRNQLSRLVLHFERIAAQKAIFVAAFTEETGGVPSNIPFVVALDGGSIAAAYGANDGFAVAVIGRDGNLDAIWSRPLPGQRILDLINNSFVAQQQFRRL